MSKVSKGPKRVVRKRPLTSTFKPRPSREIDDRSYFKKRKPDDREERPRRSRDDDARPRPRRSDDDRPRPRRTDSDERPRPRRDYDDSRPSRPRRDDRDGPPRGRPGGSFGPKKFGDRKFEPRSDRPPREDRAPADNRILMDTVKRLESGMMEVLDRLARIEKEIAGMKE